MISAEEARERTNEINSVDITVEGTLKKVFEQIDIEIQKGSYGLYISFEINEHVSIKVEERLLEKGFSVTSHEGDCWDKFIFMISW